MSKEDSAASMVRLVKSMLRKERSGFSPFVEGTFVAAETSDPNLSKIKIFGQTQRFVRKAKHIGTIAVNEQVLCVRGHGQNLIIIAIITGDITNLS